MLNKRELNVIFALIGAGGFPERCQCGGKKRGREKLTSFISNTRLIQAHLDKKITQVLFHSVSQ
jgi:hypothetical protein